MVYEDFESVKFVPILVLNTNPDNITYDDMFKNIYSS